MVVYGEEGEVNTGAPFGQDDPEDRKQAEAAAAIMALLSDKMGSLVQQSSS